MIDAMLRPLIDPPLNLIARQLTKAGITANQITIAGFVTGLAAVPLIATHHEWLALLAIAVNRLSDGVDGAVARMNGITDLGGYLDIVLDFIFYSAIIFGFTLAQPDQAVYGTFLIFSFIGTGTSFLAYSIFAAKRNIHTSARGKKSFYYLGGLTEGFETIVALALMCIFPEWFWVIALTFGMMCWITTVSRIAWARQTL